MSNNQQLTTNTHLETAMLYLAQVNKNPISGEIELSILAHQKSEQVWEVVPSYSVVFGEQDCYHQDVLVLVEMGKNKEVIRIEYAKAWILEIIAKYLHGNIISPEIVEKEQLRIEQWRQEITAQSLDLTRRHLEIETRRDQLQELETSLKQEQEKLESRWQQLHQLQEKLENQQENLADYSEPIQESQETA